MKKSLVLAMAMALGVTASAYAANPFSDVPAGHWAYDSIAKLAAAGVVDGYPDGAFKGQNLMTRYEMAQIVAKAMAKGANVEALAAEFADELDNLGVRVAALENKMDNTRITGQIRYHYATHNKKSKMTGGKSESQLRTRLWLAGQVNEDWKYTAMLQQIQNFRDDVDNGKDIEFQRAYLNGRLFGLKICAGRYSWTAPNATSDIVAGDIYDTRVNGIEATYGKDVSLNFGFGKGTSKQIAGKDATDRYYFANLKAKLGKATEANVGYYKFTDVRSQTHDEGGSSVRGDLKLWNVGLKGKAGKFLLSSDYLRGNGDIKDGSNNGFLLGVQYKGANKNKPGTYGIYAKYYNLGANTYVLNGMNEAYPALSNQISNSGFTGYGIGANYTFAKNIVGGIEFIDLKPKMANDGDDKVGESTLWTQLVFSF